MSSLFEFIALRPDVKRALRATVAFVVPLVAFHAMGWHGDALFVAMAAQATALPDLRGAYRMRLAILVAMTLIVAGSAMLGVLAGGHNVTSMLAMGVVALLAGCWHHLSADYGAPVSVTSVLIFLLGLAHPGSPAAAWHMAGLILLGASFTIVLSMAFWPIRPRHPLRDAVAESWMAASDLAARMRPDLASHAGPLADLVAQGERELRAALDRSYVILSTGATRRSAAFIVQLEEMRLQAVQFGMRLAAWHSSCDALAKGADALRLLPVMDSCLKALSDAARSVAVTLVTERAENLALTGVRLKRAQQLLEVLDTQLGETQCVHDCAHLRAAIPPLSQVLEDISTALKAKLDPEHEAMSLPAIPPEIGGQSLRSLVAWINPSPQWDPLLVRYALRMAVLTMIAVAFFKAFQIHNGYWIAFTIVVVLQPDYGATRQRAAERIAGTVAGSLLGSALLWIKMPLFLLDACAAGMSFAFAYFLKRRYGVAVFFVTLMLVLVTETMMQVHLDFTITRLLSNLLGGAMALGAAFAFWPVSEEPRFHSLLAAAIRANADYAASLAAFLNSAPPEKVDILMAKRRAENAERFAAASLQRLVTEPRGTCEAAAGLATYNQRITRALITATVHLQEQTGEPALDADAALHSMTVTLQSLASTVEGSPNTETPTTLKALVHSLNEHLSQARASERNAPRQAQLILAHLTKCATEIQALAMALGDHREAAPR